LKDDGTADVVFVMSHVLEDEIFADDAGRKLHKAIGKVFKSYVVITLKETSGKCDDLESLVDSSRAYLDRVVVKHKANAICVLGANLSRALVPALRKFHIDTTGTFHEYTARSENRKRKVMLLTYLTPRRVFEDVYETVRIPETLAKLHSVGVRRYHEAPVIHNLDSYKKARDYIRFLSHDHNGVIGFDTETYSLNIAHHQRLGSMQFCHDDKEASVLLWDSKHQVLSRREMDRLREPLQFLFNSHETSFDAWTMHNGMFDVNQIATEFKPIRFAKPILDGMYAFHLLDENRKTTKRADVHATGQRGQYALKILCTEFNGFFHYAEEAMKARGNGTLMELPLPDFLQYAGNDPVVTYRLLATAIKWASLDNYDDQMLNILRNLHSRAITTYSNMSRKGILIDKNNLMRLLARDSVINKRLKEIEEAYKSIEQVRAVNNRLAMYHAGSTKFLRMPWVFDISKTLHRTELFFTSKYGFKIPQDEEKGTSTGKAFLKANKDNPVVKLYQEAQGLKKLKVSYVKPIYERLFSPTALDTDVCDGRVHPQFHLNRTVTGRLASSDPNCIVAGTQVRTPTGLVAIENLEVGDMVTCTDGLLNLTKRPVLNKWYKGRQSCVRVFWFGNGRLDKFDCTLDHKVMLSSGEYMEAGMLRSGDTLACYHGNSVIEATVFETQLLAHQRDVWDVEIAEHHNFFAGDINVSNCQQVPRSDSPVKKEIKSLFIPKKGYVFIQADLSSAEVRVWGALSGDAKICELSSEAFRLNRLSRMNPDDVKLMEEANMKANFHKQTYALCFNKSPWDVTDSERQDAKKLNFGLMYGMGDNSLAREIGKPMDEVLEIKRRYFSVYKDGSAWFERQKKFAVSHGYVETPFGRRRRFPQVFTGDKGFITQAERFAVNAPIQATSSDYAMLSTCLLDEAIYRDGTGKYVRILNAVHDSVVLEVRATKKWILYASKLIRKTFTKTVTKQIKKDFKFEMLAPIDLDFEISQHKMKKCEACGNKYYMWESACGKKIPTGKKDKDGKDETVKCGCKEHAVLPVNGWGYLMKLEENERGIERALCGINSN
jgi:DNA polymerase I-like protein with 3'-5' exonuclease and polymerase domains